MTRDADNNEEKFVEFVQGAARSYNDPVGQVPREEMWSAIVMARREAAQARAARRRYTWIAGMAATLVIGVAIGRVASRVPSTSGGAAAGTAPSAGQEAAYDVATLAHLGRAEALLISYTSASAAIHADSALARWARDVLANTRLLLDSPMGTDVRRRRILRDLERVLVQMVQVSPAETDADARAHVERSLERTRMMMRLRSLKSATPVSGS